jgi:hypothetical protein
VSAVAAQKHGSGYLIVRPRFRLTLAEGRNAQSSKLSLLSLSHSWVFDRSCDHAVSCGHTIRTLVSPEEQGRRKVNFEQSTCIGVRKI